MRIHRGIRGSALAAIALLIGAASASAQDAGKAGITMGYPASFGVIWHLNDKVAIRPELSLSGRSSESSSGSFTSESDGWSISTGVSALFYTSKSEHLRTYFSPGYTFSRASVSATSSGVTTSKTTVSGNTHGGSGSFGAQYALGEKFAVFGELGFAFSHGTTSLSTIGSKSSGNAWGTRSGVGIIFYP